VQVAAWDKVAKETNFNLEIDLSQFIERVPSEEKVLDYGCGYGRITELLYQNGYNNIIGIDTSGEMIRRGKLMHPHLLLHKAQESKLNFPEGTFGAVIVCAVLTCLPEYQQKVDTLTEIKRVLRPGGIMHIAEFCNESNNMFMSKMGVLMHHQNPKELKNLFTSFIELNTKVFETLTMGGSNAKALNLLWPKKHLTKPSI